MKSQRTEVANEKFFQDGRHCRLAKAGSPATARGCGELAKGSPRHGRCRDSILFLDVIVINQGGAEFCRMKSFVKIIIDMHIKCFFCGSKIVVRNGLRGRKAPAK